MIANPAPSSFLAARTPSADTEAMDVLVQAVRALPALDRLVMTLYYEEGLRLPEIAAVLEIGELDVAHIYSRAFAALRGQMRVTQRQAA